MTITDIKFGAEFITKKGKIFKYDGAECMLNSLSAGKISLNDADKILVVDAVYPKTLIDAPSSYYLISENLPSPMGANLSSYSKKSDAESQKIKYGGELKNWDELLLQFKIK